MTDRDGHFVRVAPGTQLVTPAKDGMVKGPDGKKIHTPDGKSAKVEGGGKEPVLVEPGNRLVKSRSPIRQKNVKDFKYTALCIYGFSSKLVMPIIIRIVIV